jgi:hypothetical protein
MWWPLRLDVNENPSVMVIDGYNKAYNAGALYIGASYINSNHNWTISNLTVGDNYSFIIYPDDIWGSENFVLHTNMGYEFNLTRISPMPLIYINFTSTSNEMYIDLYHDYRGMNDVLLKVNEYRII